MLQINFNFLLQYKSNTIFISHLYGFWVSFVSTINRYCPLILCLLFKCFCIFTRNVYTQEKTKKEERQAVQNQYGDYTYPALSSYYPHPSMVHPPHPPLMYPVPMVPVHSGYAPWLVPQQGFSEMKYGPSYGRNHGR